MREQIKKAEENGGKSDTPKSAEVEKKADKADDLEKGGASFFPEDDSKKGDADHKVVFSMKDAKKDEAKKEPDGTMFKLHKTESKEEKPADKPITMKKSGSSSPWKTDWQIEDEKNRKEMAEELKKAQAERSKTEPAIPLKPKEESLSDLTARWDTAAKVCTQRNQALRKAIADGAGKDEIARMQKDVHDANVALSKIGEAIDAHHKKSREDAKKDDDPFDAGPFGKAASKAIPVSEGDKKTIARKDYGIKGDNPALLSVLTANYIRAEQSGDLEKAYEAAEKLDEYYAKTKEIMAARSDNPEKARHDYDLKVVDDMDKLYSKFGKTFARSTKGSEEPKIASPSPKPEKLSSPADWGKKYIESVSSGKKSPSPEAKAVRDAMHESSMDGFTKKQTEAISSYLTKEGFMPKRVKTYQDEYDYGYESNYYDACFELDSDEEVPRLKKAISKMMKASGIGWGTDDEGTNEDAIDIRPRKHTHADGTNYRARIWAEPIAM